MGWWGGGPTPARTARLERRVAALEAQVDALIRASGVDPRSLPSAAPTCSPEVVALAREGQVIAAIKLHRQQTGLGLAEAKADIDDLR